MTNAEENELEQVIALEWMNAFKSFERQIAMEEAEKEEYEKNFKIMTEDDWDRVFKNYTDTLK